MGIGGGFVLVFWHPAFWIAAEVVKRYFLLRSKRYNFFFAKSVAGSPNQRKMPRPRIGRPEARQIVLTWLTFNWSTRKLEARFHYAPSTIKRLLRYWRRHQALPHDTRVRRRDARCLNRKGKRLIRRKVAQHGHFWKHKS